MILEGLLIGLVSAIVRGGKIAGLADLPFKYPWALVAALLLRIGAIELAGRGIPFFIEYGALMQLIAFILLSAALWLNYPILRVTAAGVTLNLVVIAANGGAMPISRPALAAAGLEGMEPVVSHIFIGAGTPLWFLGDVIPLVPPYPFTKVISIGDIVLLVGVIIYINWAMKDRLRTQASS